VVIYRIAVFMAVLASYTVSFLFAAACFVVTTFTLLLMKNVLCASAVYFSVETLRLQLDSRLNLTVLTAEYRAFLLERKKG
jgi:Zn-dependent membrane protease YugP